MIWLCVLVAALALAFFGRDALARAWRPGVRRPRAAAAHDTAPHALTAQDLLADCARLASAGAPWAEIAARINPSGDAEVDTLLQRLRAAHDGIDVDVLRAIEAGCRAALAQNAEAGAFDALTEATRSSRWTSTAKW